MKNYFLFSILLLSNIIVAQEILKLDDAISLALKQNPNILVAANEKELAEVANNWYAAGRIPTVSVNGFFNNSLTNLNQKLNNGTSIERNGVRNTTLNGNA
ncbi:MAG: TolC family protein, partial [Saprospiraceae bacterium]